jgi:hypothetical protein
LTGRFESALAQWLRIPGEELIFAPGATGGNLLALLTLANSDSTVLVEDPMYEPMSRQAGRVSHVKRITRSFDDQWQIPLDRAKALIDDDTDIVIITDPHNPSGVFAPVDQVMELAAMASKKGAYLLINEVYRGFTNRPSYHRTAENIVVVSSLSKLLGTYWMRLGWLSAAKPIVDRLRVGHTNMGVPSIPSAAFGLAVMEKVDDLLAAARRAPGQGLATVKAWVETTPGVSWHVPDGIGFGCVKLPPGVDDVAFAEKLLEQSGVLVIPGTMFSAPGTLRVSWLQSGDQLQFGLSRIAEALRTV